MGCPGFSAYSALRSSDIFSLISGAIGLEGVLDCSCTTHSGNWAGLGVNPAASIALFQPPLPKTLNTIPTVGAHSGSPSRRDQSGQVGGRPCAISHSCIASMIAFFVHLGGFLRLAAVRW